MKEAKIIKTERVFEVLFKDVVIKSFFNHLQAVTYAFNNYSNLDECTIREATYYVFEGGLRDYTEDL